ncbi:MAG: pyrimidine 5'-nucleotidase [Anaerolineae bacterium]
MALRDTVNFVLFDLDDTLYPKESGLFPLVSQRIDQYMVERLGLPPQEAKELRAGYMRRYGTTTRGLQLHHQVKMDDYLHYVHDVPVEEFLSPDPKLAQVLAGIRAKKAIFTNAPKEYCWRVLCALGLEAYFDYLFALEFMNYIGKPDPQVYGKVLEALGASAEECLIVEDISRNLMPAKQLGMVTVLVGSEVAPYVDYAIEDITEIGLLLAEGSRGGN